MERLRTVKGIRAHREWRVHADEIDREKRTVPVSISSEFEVLRWDWDIGEFRELLGHDEGSPFYKLGILGRAAVEEKAGTADLPFYYTSLVLVMRYLSENIQKQLVFDGKITGLSMPK